MNRERASLPPGPNPETRPAGALLRNGRSQDRVAGRLDEAMASYQQAVRLAESCRGWWRPEVFMAFLASVGAPNSKVEIPAVA